ncbi:ABC transporter ATP-binding protein [Proteocatella sphenisci]|uniref:ABC transporter ATP-binding protein n=1 Tax=Proteocatella sphenisci TaxID=181070 RepID=UPI00048F9818|nr:ABC transporter ATP-binding protein [Proteocatella sphenisci]
MAFFEADNIYKSYDGERILENVRVKLEKGELVSLLGESGTGKTTLFNIMSGLEKPESGRVTLDGKDVTGIPGKISYMQQKDLLLPFMNIIDNVSVPLRIKGVSKAEARKTAARYIQEFGLEGSEGKYPAQLSGGMRQRAAFLRAYLYSDNVMLLDEPFSALDSITKSSMHQWYKDVAKIHGTTTFFITHDIDEAILLSDRIYIMQGPIGHIRREFKVESSGDRGSDFGMTQEFIKLKREILEFIKV